ncbi:MAG TPA: hypothetical protein VK763_19155 [Terriglobales bacterium]|jgi:hypothetical protein|nr:hypothetical protein [Terriglobales bacterium]
MFGFLKRAAGMADAYATGKAYEHWYKIAELTTMMYIEKLYEGDYGRSFWLSVWSYLLCTMPKSQEILNFREEHEADIERAALDLMEEDEPFRQVIVSTLWVALGMCRAYDDKAGFDRILDSEVFKAFSPTYPMLSPQGYATTVESWSSVYSPPPA